jgi:hypothetical protein
MPIHDHEPNFLGRAFFWGGIGLGVLLLAALLTRGFGLWGGAAHGDEGPAPMVRQGGKIMIPEGSPLRGWCCLGLSNPIRRAPPRCSRR